MVVINAITEYFDGKCTAYSGDGLFQVTPSLEKMLKFDWWVCGIIEKYVQIIMLTY